MFFRLILILSSILKKPRIRWKNYEITKYSQLYLLDVRKIDFQIEEYLFPKRAKYKIENWLLTKVDHDSN